MTLSRHVYSVEIVGTGGRVSPLSGSVTLDESWSPYVQAQVTIPLPNDPAVLDALDPRRGARVRITLVQRFGSSQPLSTVSTDWNGLTLADVSDLYAGDQVLAMSAAYGQSYNGYGIRPSTRRRLTLGVRSRVVDRASGTVDVTLASDEAKLQDFALVTKTAVTPTSATVRDAAEMVLGAIGATLLPGDADGTIEADAVAWEPGVTAWSYIDPLVKAAGLRLYCDERQRWHLVQPLAPSEGSLTLSTSTASQIEESISRDDGWYDAVVVKYSWTDSGGVDRTRYDTAEISSDYSKVLTLEYDRPWPGDGAALTILSRARGRGRIESVTTVSDYSATPGQALSITVPNEPVQTGMTTRITWDLATDEMQVRSRDLIDTPTNAWALIQPGTTWQDIPVGMDWNELEFSNG